MISISESKVLDWHFGHSTITKQGKKKLLQGTRKIGCIAHIDVKALPCYCSEQAYDHKEGSKGISWYFCAPLLCTF